nr:LapA family protein [uncultured Roseateles sp.]
MRIFIWLFRAFLFFTLFAFALNNSHEVVVRWFFGHEWHAPLVIIVLTAFGLGCGFGVLAMVPAWWHHRRVAKRAPLEEGAGTTPATTDPMPPTAIHDGI